MSALGRLVLAGLGILAYSNREKISAWLGSAGAENAASAQDDDQRRGLFDRLHSGGGLHDLLDRFRAAGLGATVDSWVGKGQNTPVGAREIEAAFDGETLDRLATESSLSRDEVVDHLARNLPEVVDSMTPEGHLPDRPEQEAALLKEYAEGGSHAR